jgi:histidinol phosphatase-like enzyme (inositol monophosphatase family)
MNSLPSIAELLEVATEVAWAGGRSTLSRFNTRLPVELKGDGSPVTAADREAERFMRALIRERYPDHTLVGEEYGVEAGSAPVRWILDPIDGTRSYIRGVPLYGTLVGVEVAGEPVVGAIAIPAQDELVAAGRGLGCHWNGRRCRVSPVARLADALSVATDLRAVRARTGDARAHAWSAAVGLERTWADCYGYVLVATGRAEVAMDAVMAVWDNAALLPVIEEAGGTFTDWQGRRRIDGPDAVATNGLLHAEALAFLAAP